MNNQHFQRRSIHQTLHHHRQNTLEERPLLRTHTQDRRLKRAKKRREIIHHKHHSLYWVSLSGDLLSPLSPTVPPLSIVMFPNICLLYGWANTTLFPPLLCFVPLKTVWRKGKREKKEGKERGREREREKGGKNGQECERREVCLRKKKGEEESTQTTSLSHSLLFISLHQREIERGSFSLLLSPLCVKRWGERERRGRRGCEEKNKPPQHKKHKTHTTIKLRDGGWWDWQNKQNK